MKDIKERIDPEKFSGWLNQNIKYYDIPRSKLIKAADISDESFLKPYLNGSSMQITDTQKKLYQACAETIADILNTEIGNAGINNDYVAQALGVTRPAIDNWLYRYKEMSDPFEKFEQIKAAIESSQYYMGFKRLPDEEFAKFFDKNDDNTLGKLWKKKGLSIEKINSDLGLTKNKSSFIRNNQQRLSTREQYEILSKAYDMCIDYTLQYYEGFEDIGWKLYQLLNLQYHEDIASNFADIYSKLQKITKFDTDELYSLLEEHHSDTGKTLSISRKAFELLCTKNTFYWDINEKAEILKYIMFHYLHDRKEFRRIAFRNFTLTMIYNNLKYTIREIEGQRWEDQLKDLSSDLKQYPLETQKIILSHAEVFLDMSIHMCFWSNHAVSKNLKPFLHPSGTRLYGRDSDIFYYIDHFIDLFRDLSPQSQLSIISKYSEEAPFYLNPYTRGLRYLTQCCDMMFQTMGAPLSGMDSPPPNPSDYMSMKKTDRRFWRFYDKNKIKKRLQYTSRDWNLVAIILLLVTQKKDLSLLEEDLRLSQKTEQPSPKDKDKSNSKKRAGKEHCD